jgi:ankyrin repeat protein
MLALVTVGSITGCMTIMTKAQKYFTDPAVAQLVDAAANGDARAVDQLAASGVSPNAEGKDGITPLLYVLSETRNKLGLRALLRAGADPNHIAPNGFSPLILSARAKDPEFLTIMLEGGGNTNLKNRDGEPVIQLAAIDDRWDNVSNLLDHGADINAADRDGYTLIMNLATLGHYEKIAWLIGRGADVHIQANNGATVAKVVKRSDLAPDSGEFAWREKVIQLLADKGVALPQ